MNKKLIKKGLKKVLGKKVKKEVQTKLFGIKTDRYINQPLDVDLKKNQLLISLWNVNGIRSVMRNDSLKNYMK